MTSVIPVKGLPGMAETCAFHALPVTGMLLQCSSITL